MSCAEIAEEIRRNLEFLSSTTTNIPERHRSLKAAFEYSWTILNPKEQEVLRKLSVFQGGFRRDAATIAGATIPLLASLVDKSLLRTLPNGRYDRHLLLHQFTKEKLAEHSDEQTQMGAKHAEFYLTLAKEAEPQLQGREQVQWLSRLDEELKNFCRALDCLEVCGEVTEALELAGALGYFWSTRGHVSLGLTYLTRLLAKSQDHSVNRGRALLHAGRLSWSRSERQAAQAFYERGLAIAETLQEKSLWAEMLTGLGRIRYYNQGNPGNARSLYESALKLARESRDKNTIASILFVLGALDHEQSNYQQARNWLTEAESLYSEVGNAQGLRKRLILWQT